MTCGHESRKERGLAMQRIVGMGAIAFEEVKIFLEWMLGGFDNYICALACFVILDCVTSIMAACVKHRFSAELVLRRLLLGACTFMIIGVANILERMVSESGTAVRTVTIIFYLSCEGRLIFKNAVDIGIEVPKQLKDMLEQMNRENGEG